MKEGKPRIGGTKQSKMPTAKERLEIKFEQLSQRAESLLRDLKEFYQQQSQMNNYFQNNIQIIPQILKEFTAHQKSLKMLFEHEKLKNIPYNEICQKAILETEEEYQKGMQEYKEAEKERLKIQGTCPDCYGYGSIQNEKNELLECSRCEGTGALLWKRSFEEEVRKGYNAIEEFVRKKYSPGDPDDISCVLDALQKSYFYSTSIWAELIKTASSLEDFVKKSG